MSENSTEQDRIENDLARTRVRMDNRLDALQERLSPGQILDDLMGYFRSSEGGDFARNLMDDIRGNPLPAALTGIGLTWLMASNPRPQRASGTDAMAAGDTPADTAPSPAIPARPAPMSSGPEHLSAASGEWKKHLALEQSIRDAEAAVVRQADETEAAYQARRHEAKAKTLGVARQTDDTEETFSKRVGDALAAAQDSVTEAWDELANKASAATQTVNQTLQQSGNQMVLGAQAAQKIGSNLIATITDNPVLLGAVGLAIGALLGALVPQSDQEEVALSGMANPARAATRDLAQGVVDQGGQVAQKILDAGRDSMQAHGLTGQKTIGDLTDEVLSGDLVGNMKQIAQDILQAGETAVRTEGLGQGGLAAGKVAPNPSPRLSDRDIG